MKSFFQTKVFFVNICVVNLDKHKAEFYLNFSTWFDTDVRLLLNVIIQLYRVSLNNVWQLLEIINMQDQGQST